MFYCVDRKHVEFDEFDDSQKCAKKILKILRLLKGDLKGSFFDAILYGFLFSLTENNKICKDKTKEILGKEFFENLRKKELLQLDHFLENFFQKCQLLYDF